jgi:hypothetical protein
VIVRVHGGLEERPVASLQELNFGFAGHKLRVRIAIHVRGSETVGVAAAAADDDDDDDDDDIVAGPGIDVHAAGLGAGLGYLSCDPRAGNCPFCIHAPRIRVRNVGS